VPHRRVVDEGVTRHHHESALLGASRQRVDFGDGGGQGLLDEHVLAAFERLPGEREVGGRGGGDDDGSDVGIVEYDVAGFHCRRLREVAFDESTSLFTRVDYVLHRAVRKGREVPEEVWSPVAAANLGDDERIEPHAAAPFCSNRRSSPASPPRIVREARKTGIPLVR